MIDIKIDIGIELEKSFFLEINTSKFVFLFKEMIVSIIHHHVVVHHQKIVHHHPIVHAIVVGIMNMKDQEVIENHHVIVMINMNVIHESNYLKYLYNIL